MKVVVYLKKNEICNKILPVLDRIPLILAILELCDTVLWYLMGLFQEPTKITKFVFLFK